MTRRKRQTTRARCILVLGVLATLLLASGVLAAPLRPRSFQASERPREVISAGHTNAMVGPVMLRGTLGQPFAGVSAGDGVTLGHGFWHPGGVHYTIYLPIVFRNRS